MAPLVEHMPPYKDWPEIPPGELSFFLLDYLKERNDEPYSKRNVSRSVTKVSDDLPDDVSRDELQRILSETIQWLENENFIAPDPDERAEWFFITRRGRRVDSQKDFESYRKGSLLPRNSLNPILVEKVWHLFVGGDYDAAVLQAFKQIEIKIREAGGFDPGDYGVDLARKAFHPEDGVLTDHEAEEGEKEALSHLMAGALGYFKNPSSHREVGHEAQAAAESIMFANYLLRVLEERERD